MLLDPHAFVRILRSDLPLGLYPCATDDGADGYGPHNTHWHLPDLAFVADMDPRLRRYLGYAFGEVGRVDFLRVLDEDLPAAVMEHVYTRRHPVWETAVWTVVSGRRLARVTDGTWQLTQPEELSEDEPVLPNELRPCTLEVDDDGFFTYELTDAPSRTAVYHRGGATLNEQALREALPSLYRAIRPPSR